MKPREFWIDTSNGFAGSEPNPEGFPRIHVIEHSAFLALEKELDELADQNMKLIAQKDPDFNNNLNAIALEKVRLHRDRLQSENAELRKERDELRANKLRIHGEFLAKEKENAELKAAREENAKLKAENWVLKDNSLRTYDGLAEKADKYDEARAEIERMKQNAKVYEENASNDADYMLEQQTLLNRCEKALEYYSYSGRNIPALENNAAGFPAGSTESERDNGKMAEETLAEIRSLKSKVENR